MAEPPQLRRRRRRRRNRIDLSGLTLEDYARFGLGAIPAFFLFGLFLKTTAQHLPSWGQLYDSITGRGAVGIVVLIALAGVCYALRRKQ